MHGLTDQTWPFPVPPGTSRAAIGLADLRAWMVRHLDQPMTLDELAARVFMSRRQFTRTFRAETGVSPWQWLLTQRVAWARSLLAGTGEQIQAIARRCGFASPAAFRTTFRHVVGLSPSGYREQAGRGGAGYGHRAAHPGGAQRTGVGRRTVTLVHIGRRGRAAAAHPPTYRVPANQPMPAESAPASRPGDIAWVRDARSRAQHARWDRTEYARRTT